MRLAWLSATAQRFAPYLGAVVVVSLAVDWLTPFDRGLAVAGVVVAGFAAGLLIRSVSIRITGWDAARAAERGLGARDAFTTALEFADPGDGVHRAIQERADSLATSSRPSEAIPIRADRRRLRQFGIAVSLATVIGLLPPLGSSPALSSDVAAALESEAENLERIAEAVEESDVETAEDIVAELERLAEELRKAETLEQAMQSIEDTETRLAGQVDPDFLSQKTAAQGLARDLALRPLTDGGPLDPGSQLQQLAGELGSLSEPELAALADRLSDLAESQSAGNSGLSNDLSDAARAIESGDPEAAASALQRAASEQDSGLEGARGQQALTETERALEGARARLGGPDAAGGEAGQGDSDGQGGGEGSGQGEGGARGEGEGGGDGQGQGGAGGQQSSGGSGEISNVAPGGGDAAGQGGQGNVGAGGTEDHGTNVETASVFSPLEDDALTEMLQVGIDGGSPDGDIVGRADGPTARGDSVVPYAQVLPEYLNQAADALGQLELPPSMRNIVQAYFERLADEAR